MPHTIQQNPEDFNLDTLLTGVAESTNRATYRDTMPETIQKIPEDFNLDTSLEDLMLL